MNQKKLKVLIVDDELNMAKAIERILAGAGFETYIASNGFEAGVCLCNVMPDVMTLDMQMPEMNGAEVLALIHQVESSASMKILLLSGKSLVELEPYLQLGADDILQKPFENEALVKKIRLLACK